MRVLIATHRNFLASGAEQLARVIGAEIERQGHEPVLFSVRYDRNDPNPYERYWKEPVQGRDAPTLAEMHLSALGKIAFFADGLYSLRSRRALEALLDAHPVDVAYVLYILNYLSPSVLDVLRERGIPTVLQVMDYQLVCLNYHALRDGKPCLKCVEHHNNQWGVVHACLHGSRAHSLSRYVQLGVQRFAGWWTADRLMFPSPWMRDVHERAGWDVSRGIIRHYPIAVSAPPVVHDAPTYVLYAGRVSHEKGLAPLADAYHASTLPWQLVIAGDADSAEALAIRARIGDDRRFEWRGFVSAERLRDIYRGASVFVMPGISYDNCPLTVYEAQGHGLAVIVTGHGSFTSQVQDGVDGLWGPPGNYPAWMPMIERLMSDAALRNRLGAAGHERVRRENAPAHFVDAITEMAHVNK